MLSENEPAAGHSHFFGQNNFVGERIFQDAVLVNARFVSEGVGADHGFIGRDGDSRDRREQAAGGIDFLEADIRRGTETALADVKRYCDFFERGITCAFTDSVDGAFHLAGSRADCGQRIRNGEAEIVVAVRAVNDFWICSEPRADSAKHFAVFIGRGVADGVWKIDDFGACFGSGFRHFAEVFDIAAACVFGGEFHFFRVLATKTHHLAYLSEGFVTLDAQLVLQVEIGGGKKNMKPGVHSRLDGAEGGVNIFLTGSRERRHFTIADFAGDGADSLQIPGRCDGKSRFDDVDAELFELASQAKLFIPVHRKAGGLLAVAQRCVEDVDRVHLRSYTRQSVDRGAGERVQFIIVACRISFAYTGLSSSRPKTGRGDLSYGRRHGGYVDLAALQVFQTVAREQSYSRAAEKLYRTQPAISIAMRKLEDWVGQPLFVRGTGARTLTDAGTLLLEYADRMLNLREEIHKGMQQLNGLKRGQVAIGVNESSIHALLPALEQYRKLYPGIQIRVHRVFSRNVPRELLNHQLDIGVISYLPEERELTTVEFYRDSLALVVWPGHPLAKRREVDISALEGETFVAHIVESPYRRRVIQMFAKHRVTLRMDIELPTIESIKRFVEMKRGVAIVPRMCVEREIARGDLRELRLRQMHIERRVYLVYRQDRPLSAAAHALVELLRPKASKGKRART
jgi:DNA-binding transcriptional LysR family regulator